MSIFFYNLKARKGKFVQDQFYEEYICFFKCSIPRPFTSLASCILSKALRVRSSILPTLEVPSRQDVTRRCDGYLREKRVLIHSVTADYRLSRAYYIVEDCIEKILVLEHTLIYFITKHRPLKRQIPSFKQSMHIYISKMNKVSFGSCQENIERVLTSKFLSLTQQTQSCQSKKHFIFQSWNLKAIMIKLRDQAMRGDEQQEINVSISMRYQRNRSNY